MLVRKFSLASRLRSAFSKTPTRFVGIDIGSRCVNVAAVSRDRNGSIRWRTHHRFELGINPLEQPSPMWIDTTIQKLVDQLPRCVDGEHNLVSLALPVSWVHYQVVLGTDLESSQSQCDAMFRGSIFQSAAHSSNWPVVGLQHGMPNQDDQYVVAAVAEDAAFRVANAIEEQGYHVGSIVPHGVALLDAATALTSVTPQAVALLNREGGMVAINHSTGCGLCRTLPNIPTNVLRQSTQHPIVLDDIRPWLSDISVEITATIRYSNQANMQDRREEPLLICGDLAKISGLDVVLAKLTGLPVATWKYIHPSRPNRRFGYSHEAIQNNAELFECDVEGALALSLAYGATTYRIGRHTE